MNTPPITFRWDGEAMVPATMLQAKLGDEHYVVGQKYNLVIQEERSKKSHDHYFATFSTLYNSLPDDWAFRFPTEDHFRRYCLIRTGWRDERTLACENNDEARRVAAFVRPFDEFAVVTLCESTVTVYTAKSQSLKAMGKRDFQKSKDDVLSFAADVCGTTVEAAQDVALTTAAA